jgi:hypothetical protein
MPYVGNQLATQFQAFVTQTITGDGSTGYTLDRAVANGKELLVYINNVKQEEGAGKAYTATGTTITFSEAVASGDSCYVVFLGSAMQTVNPPDGSVGSSQMSSADLVLPKTVTIGSAAEEDTKLVFDGNAQDYYVGLDDSADALTIGVGSTLGTNTAMTVNSSGLVAPKIPILQVRAINTDQSYSSSSGIVKVQWQTVELDSLSGWDSSNNRYTPTVAGYYLCGGALRVNLSNNVERFRCWISKNGGNLGNTDSTTNQSLHVGLQHTSDTIENSSVPLPTGLLEMNGSSDYIEVYFDSEENATIHDSTFAKSYFFAQLVHAT